MKERPSKITEWEQLARQANFHPGVMAALCPISIRHLERLFSRAFNQTPSAWLRELRCRMAKQLISEGWSTKAVAAELDFADEAHFCHVFKRVYGVSPQTFAPGYGNKTRNQRRL
jgi:AraC-like DNA-binding protein